MGMYDNIRYKMNCPKCGAKVDTFQSKDGPCMLSELDFWEVNNFYTDCDKCDTWIEFDRKKPVTPSPIKDYVMSLNHNRG